MTMIDLLLCHATVVTMDEHGTILHDGAVAVHGDTIVAIDSTASLTARSRSSRDAT